MKRPCSSLTVVALLALQGCYVYAPLQTPAPPTGETVVMQISDQGRVALGERLGPGVMDIRGRVLSTAGDQLSMSVASVGYVSGEQSMWSGESVTFNREYVSNVRVRTLSKSRTWTTVAVVAVVAGTFIATRGLFSFFNDLPDGDSDGGEPPQSLRLKIGFSF